ncbi:MAG: hypothetical protein HAW62_02695 [Endozoicomonadaceae bacterium]|nr:hypothetical protein [Endozoicomonadaceae bacterium]
MHQKISKTICLGLLTISSFLLFNQSIAGGVKLKLTPTIASSDLATPSDLTILSDDFESYIDTCYIKHFTLDAEDDDGDPLTVQYCQLVDMAGRYLLYAPEHDVGLYCAEGIYKYNDIQKGPSCFCEACDYCSCYPYQQKRPWSNSQRDTNNKPITTLTLYKKNIYLMSL